LSYTDDDDDDDDDDGWWPLMTHLERAQHFPGIRKVPSRGQGSNSLALSLLAKVFSWGKRLFFSVTNELSFDRLNTLTFYFLNSVLRSKTAVSCTPRSIVIAFSQLFKIHLLCSNSHNEIECDEKIHSTQVKNRVEIYSRICETNWQTCSKDSLHTYSFIYLFICCS